MNALKLRLRAVWIYFCQPPRNGLIVVGHGFALVSVSDEGREVVPLSAELQEVSQ